jgi:hypothetical protein
MIQFSILRPVQSAALAMALLAGWSTLSPAAQAAIKFTKIFQSGDTAPGSQNKFEQSSFSTPVVSGSRVAFSATFLQQPVPAGTIPYPFGVYKFSSGKLEKQLDSSTLIPNSPNERFGGLRLGAISLQGDQVIVSSYAADSILYVNFFKIPIPKIKGGIYGFQNGKVSVIADTETTAPDGQKFSGFGFSKYQGPEGSWGVSANANQVVFGATAASNLAGLYLFRDGKISALIDENTINPINGSKLGFFSFQLQYNRYAAAVDQFEIKGSQIVFLPAFPPFTSFPASPPFSSGAPQVFSVQPQKLTTLVSNNDPLPGTSAKALGFRNASINSKGALAFADDSRNGRIFLKQQNQIRLIYQTGQTVPGLRTTPKTLGKVCLSGSQVTFNSDAGLLVSRGGQVSALVQPGDQLSGKTVSSIDAGSNRYCSGRFFAFVAGFTDGTSGMYRGEILPDMNALVAGQPDEADE